MSNIINPVDETVKAGTFFRYTQPGSETQYLGIKLGKRSYIAISRRMMVIKPIQKKGCPTGVIGLASEIKKEEVPKKLLAILEIAQTTYSLDR